MNLKTTLLAILTIGTSFAAETQTSGNPILPGVYADPEAVVFDNQYWIYPTTSLAFEDQLYFDAFSSPDLVTWTKHERIIDNTEVTWATHALWAPSAIEKDGKYYLFFSANDIKNNDQLGGIGVAVADRPEGPFKDLLGQPLIKEIVGGAQPIDQFVFEDKGTYYIVYGGWKHCNLGMISDDFKSLIPFPDGEMFREITPEDYKEGPVFFRRKGKLYFMWSENSWAGPDYRVAYAIADSIDGPFDRVATVLEKDPEIAAGAGHHSVLNVPGTDDWYIVYHRRPLGSEERDYRVTCIDKMEFNDDGTIKPVKMTMEGVEKNPFAATE